MTQPPDEAHEVNSAQLSSPHRESADTEETMSTQEMPHTFTATDDTMQVVQGGGHRDEPPRATSLQDVRMVTRSFVRGHAQTASMAMRKRPGIVALIAVALVGLILFVTTSFVRATALPTADIIERDARAQATAPSYQAGMFGSQEPLVVTNVQLGERHVESRGQATASVAMTWENKYVEATADVALHYRYEDNAWVCAELETGQAAFVALQGIDTEHLIGSTAAIAEVLRRGEATWQASNRQSAQTSLATLYDRAAIFVVREDFDAASQKDVAVLHFSKAATFTSYEADITARFSFRPGTGEWELTAAEASADAKEISYAPLEGSWQATFESQTSTGAGKCFGAQKTQVELTVDRADSLRIEGTLRGLAHFHAELDEDAAQTEGDEALSGVHFEGTRTTETAGIAFDCTISEMAGGTLTLRLDFGSAEHPDVATATLTSLHDYDATLLFVPYRREAEFSDTFTLVKG